MVKKRTINVSLIARYAIPVVIAVAVGVWYYVTHTPEAVVKKRLRALAEVVSKPAGEGNASMAYKMLAFENMLDDNVECQVAGFPYNGTNSANTLSSLLFRGRGMLDKLDFSILDSEVELTGDDKAVVRCAGKVWLQYGGKTYSESRNLAVIFRKQGRKWRLAEVRDDQLLKK